ncbi:MAG: mucoidy inhibitor MuiA family protein [Oligoflexia bacterium]|nr:mucoidy inhibitor MuiA family protein [Oligoflexia bacterium]
MGTERMMVDAPAVEVVVLEDRAQVRRRITVDLPAGFSALRVCDVAPVISDKTLRGEVPGGGGSVVDLRVRRSARIREADLTEEESLRREQLRELQRQAQDLSQRADRRSGDIDALLEMRRQVLDDVAQDVAWGASTASDWQASLALIDAHEAELRADRLALTDQLVDLERRIADLGRLLASMRGPTSTMAADLDIDVVMDVARTVELDIFYVSPGACWRPLHRANLGGDGDHGESILEVSTFGCVWQNTGEDWSGARVRLSTRRASLGVEPPLLTEDRLSSRPRQDQLQVELRDQAIETTGPTASSKIQSGELPGIDDGGEVRTLDVRGRPELPGDGRPHLLPLGGFTTEAQVQLVAMPELALAVLRRVRATNEGATPLLAGPVELIAGGGRIGRGTLLYVAPGARFELAFGPDPALRIHRDVQKVDQEPGVLSRWLATDTRVSLHLSNIGEEARSFELTERVPVSELEQVRVTVDRAETSEGLVPDADGMIHWTLDLAAGETATRVLAWRLEKKKDVAGI